jgi:hypothetical protein
MEPDARPRDPSREMTPASVRHGGAQTAQHPDFPEKHKVPAASSPIAVTLQGGK